MMSETTKPKKAKKTRGPEPERLKVKGDWKDAVKKSFDKQIVKRTEK